MELVVKEHNKKYELNLGNITQILGYNFRIKEYVYQSFLKYFSLYKYQEYDEQMEDNIMINGEVPGRKEYTVIGIENRKELIEQIRISKNNLIYEYLKNVLETLKCQKQLNLLDENLTNIYNAINEKLSQNIGSISIDYEMQNLFYIVSKSCIYTNTGNDVETMSNYELIIVLLKLIKENNGYTPAKTIVLLKDIDHLCSKNEYKKVIEYLIDYDKNIFVILFISIDRYVCVNREIMNNIAVFNDMSFQVPNYEVIEEYLSNHYPINYEFSESELCQLLKNILNGVGSDNEIITYKQLLTKKLINKAVCVNDFYDFNMTNSELACLNAK